MRTKNLGLGFKVPLNSIQSSNFPDEKSLYMLLGSKNLASMKKLRSKLQPLKKLYQFFLLPLMYEAAKVT